MSYLFDLMKTPQNLILSTVLLSASFVAEANSSSLVQQARIDATQQQIDAASNIANSNTNKIKQKNSSRKLMYGSRHKSMIHLLFPITNCLVTPFIKSLSLTILLTILWLPANSNGRLKKQ